MFAAPREGLLVRRVSNVEYPLVLSLLVRFACTINFEYPLLLSLFVGSPCAINFADPLLLIPFVWFTCTINFADPLLALEQGKRSSPKILCRGPTGVLTNPVFDLLVRAL